jgi:hypothetical protein
VTAIFALLLAAAAPAATPTPEPPSVPMDVAKARVAMIKTLLGAASSGSDSALKSVIGPDANANFNGAVSALDAKAIAPLGSCRRNGPFTVSEDGVMVKMACTGTLPADATVLFTFTNEKISSVVAGPSAPPVPAGA